MSDFSKKINWKKIQNLVPAVIQSVVDGKVLMLGYMDKDALKKTLRTKKVWFYSRTKGRLWMKGETSGNILKVVNVRLDCDGDALLVEVIPKGNTCHLRTASCFGDAAYKDVFAGLYAVIDKRKKSMPKGSYTAFLFKKGIDKICAKVGEESGEVIKAAQKESKKRLVEESVDLLYHLFVLDSSKGVDFDEILSEIIKRS